MKVIRGWWPTAYGGRFYYRMFSINREESIFIRIELLTSRCFCIKSIKIKLVLLSPSGKQINKSNIESDICWNFIRLYYAKLEPRSKWDRWPFITIINWKKYRIDKAILWLTWGRRKAYPKFVTAHYRLWLKWFLKFPFLGPIIKEAKRHHGSRQKRKIKLQQDQLMKSITINSKKGNLMNDEVMEQVVSKAVSKDRGFDLGQAGATQAPKEKEEGITKE